MIKIEKKFETKVNNRMSKYIYNSDLMKISVNTDGDINVYFTAKYLDKITILNLLNKALDEIKHYK